MLRAQAGDFPSLTVGITLAGHTHPRRTYMATDCLFCKMVSGAIKPATVHEDDDVLAFKDINPRPRCTCWSSPSATSPRSTI